MYPILYRLAAQGCISFYEQKTGIRKTRVYYHIETLGSERLKEMKGEFYHAVEVASFLLESKAEGMYRGARSRAGWYVKYKGCG